MTLDTFLCFRATGILPYIRSLDLGYIYSYVDIHFTTYPYPAKKRPEDGRGGGRGAGVGTVREAG